MTEELLRCARCGTTNNLVNHHICYDPEITQPLCRKCNSLWHKMFPDLIPKPENFIYKSYHTPEKILIRVTPEVKKRWATTVFLFVGRKGKRFKTVNDLLEDMIKKYAPIITIKHG